MDISIDFNDDLYRHNVSGFGHELPMKNEVSQCEKGELHRVILSTYSMNSTRRLCNIKPLSGSATVGVEKDEDGNTKGTAEIAVSSSDGSVEITASGSVDQDGNTSGKIEASINWKE